LEVRFIIVTASAPVLGSVDRFAEVRVPRPREVSDAEIIRVARKVFLERGTQVSVAAVAAELGVSAATLFVRMGSKKRLISAALWPPDPPILATLRAGFRPSGPVGDQLREIFLALAQYAEAEIPATFTLYAAGLRAKPGEDFSDVAPRQLRVALARWLTQAARAEQLTCNPRVFADVAIGAIEARAMHAFLARRPHSPRETRTFVGELVKALLAGAA
jgi:AcrR family transcriptional regulator